MMIKKSIHKNKARVGNRRRIWCCLTVIMSCGFLMLSGCLSVPKHQQRLVSKPNMQFSGSAVFSYQDRLLSQFESGSTSFKGGQSANCGSCTAGGTR
ncbi:hypothetical protein ACFL1N_01555 [Thermodesulfobacteriota bacterium]